MHVDEVMVVPGQLGRVTFQELAEQKIEYVRNGENKVLREYVKKKLNFDFDQFYFQESSSGKFLLVMDDRRNIGTRV